MRLLSPSLTVFAIISWRTESSINSYNQTSVAALASPSAAHSLGTTTFVAQSLLEQNGTAAGDIAHDPLGEEERISISQPISTKAIKTLHSEISTWVREMAAKHPHVVEEWERPLELQNKLDNWLGEAYAFNAQYAKLSSSNVLGLLINGDDQQKLWYIRLLCSLRSNNDKKFVTDRLMKRLVVAYPDLLRLMNRVWLEAKVNPDDVFKMMSIEVVDKNARNSVWMEKAKTWLDYIDRFNSPGYDYSDTDAIKMLAKFRGNPDAARFLFWLTGFPGMRKRAKAMVKPLVAPLNFIERLKLLFTLLFKFLTG